MARRSDVGAQRDRDKPGAYISTLRCFILSLFFVPARLYLQPYKLSQARTQYIRTPWATLKAWLSPSKTGPPSHNVNPIALAGRCCAWQMLSWRSLAWRC